MNKSQYFALVGLFYHIFQHDLPKKHRQLKYLLSKMGISPCWTWIFDIFCEPHAHLFNQIKMREDTLGIAGASSSHSRLESVKSSIVNK